MQSVEHRNENVCWYQETQNIRAANEPILCAIGVDFSRRANDGHSRLEGGHERQRERQALDAPVCEQKLSRGALATSGEGVVQPDGHGGHQQQRKYHIINNSEVLGCRWIHTETSGMKRDFNVSVA